MLFRQVFRQPYNSRYPHVQINWYIRSKETYIIHLPITCKKEQAWLTTGIFIPACSLKSPVCRISSLPTLSWPLSFMYNNPRNSNDPTVPRRVSSYIFKHYTKVTQVPISVAQSDTFTWLVPMAILLKSFVLLCQTKFSDCRGIVHWIARTNDKLQGRPLVIRHNNKTETRGLGYWILAPLACNSGTFNFFWYVNIYRNSLAHQLAHCTFVHVATLHNCCDLFLSQMFYTISKIFQKTSLTDSSGDNFILFITNNCEK